MTPPTRSPGRTLLGSFAAESLMSSEDLDSLRGTSRRLQRLLAADERAQAFVLLAAGGATVEVGAQPGNREVGVMTRELELDVPVELLEALLAADLWAVGAQEPVERLCQVRCVASARLLEPQVEAFVGQLPAQLAARVVECLVERAARGAKAVGEHVDRDVVESERYEHTTLMRRQRDLDRLLDGM